MKRMILLALVGCFVLVWASSASALQLLDRKAVQAPEEFDIELAETGLRMYGGVSSTGTWENNPGFTEQNERNFLGETDWNLGFDVIRGDFLHGQVQLYQEQDWGTNGAGSGDDAAVVNSGAAGPENGANDLLIEEAWIEFNVPNFDAEPTAASLKVGDFGIAFPGIGANALDDTANGIALSVPFSDMFATTLGFARMADRGAGDVFDLYYATMPLTGNGFNLTPFLGYGTGDITEEVPEVLSTTAIDETVGADVSGWWVGADLGVDMFDPLYFSAGFVYGDAEGDDFPAGTLNGVNANWDGDSLERTGWIFDASVDYKMEWFTPSLFFVYGSGADEGDFDNEEITIMPSMEGGNYKPFNALDDFNSEFAGGLWAVAFMLKDIPCPIPMASDCVSHEFILGYAQGTSDKELADTVNGGGLSDVYGGIDFTEEDSYFTVEFANTWTMYDNLAANLFFGYTAPDFDDGIGNRIDDNDPGFPDEDYTTVEATLSYSF